MARRVVWLYFRFPLGLCRVEELLAARGIIVAELRSLQPVAVAIKQHARETER